MTETATRCKSTPLKRPVYVVAEGYGRAARHRPRSVSATTGLGHALRKVTGLVTSSLARVRLAAAYTAPPSRRPAVGADTGSMTNTGLTIVQRALLAGEDLSAGTISWGRRPQPPPRLALTDRDLRLMALLYGANFLSMSHLTALGWGFSRERAAQMRLKRLHDAGYVDHFRPASAYGRAEWNYRLTSLGFSALRECEMVTNERRYTPVPLTSISYAEHDLQLASIVLHIAQEAAIDGEEALIGQMPFRWLGPRNGHIEIDGDGETERSPAAQLPPGTSPLSRRQSHGLP